MNYSLMTIARNKAAEDGVDYGQSKLQRLPRPDKKVLAFAVSEKDAGATMSPSLKPLSQWRTAYR